MQKETKVFVALAAGILAVGGAYSVTHHHEREEVQVLKQHDEDDVKVDINEGVVNEPAAKADISFEEYISVIYGVEQTSSDFKEIMKVINSNDDLKELFTRNMNGELNTTNYNEAGNAMYGFMNNAFTTAVIGFVQSDYEISYINGNISKEELNNLYANDIKNLNGLKESVENQMFSTEEGALLKAMNLHILDELIAEYNSYKKEVMSIDLKNSKAINKDKNREKFDELGQLFTQSMYLSAKISQK